MIKIINNHVCMRINGKEIPVNTEAYVSSEEYQLLCVMYPDVKRILEKIIREEPKMVVIQDKTYEIEKKKKKKHK